MGAIKDVVGLVSDLIKSVKDREFAENLRVIQGMIIDIQSEQAIQHEKNIGLMTENAELKITISELNQEVIDVKSVRDQTSNKIPEESQKMLISIASSNEDLIRDTIVERSGLSKVKGDHIFDILVKNKYIEISHGDVGIGMYYIATPDGREYLASLDLFE